MIGSVIQVIVFNVYAGPVEGVRGGVGVECVGVLCMHGGKRGCRVCGCVCMKRGVGVECVGLYV